MKDKMTAAALDKGSTVFLRAVVLLIGLFILAICAFGLPVALRSDNTGYYRPIVIGLYIAAIPFFYALYQTLKLLDNIDKNLAFSEASVGTLRRIKYCALVISGLFVLGLPYVYIVADRDDAPGGIVVAGIIAFASFVIAVFAAVLQKLIQNAARIKSENDLTV